MGKTFNELFDDFFKKNNINPNDKLSETLKDEDEAERMIKMLSNFKDITSIDDNIEAEMDKSLGKPDKIEFYEEGGLFYEKRIWHTPNGDLIKLIISDDPTLINMPKFEKPLQEQLDEAVAEENYEKAAAIRDKMTGKKVRKSRKKSNND